MKKGYISSLPVLCKAETLAAFLALTVILYHTYTESEIACICLTHRQICSFKTNRLFYNV